MAAKKKKRKNKQHRFFWFIIKLQIVLMLAVLGAFGYYYFGGYADEVQQLRREAVQEVADSDESTFIPSQTCSVYDTDGNLISERKGSKDAQYVKYEDIPQSFVTAIISIEDKKFYRHNGVDFKAVVRAVKSAIKNRRLTQGGSTITMQLAKLIYMDSEQTWQYKVKQMFLAMELEKRYSKEKILEFYLNNIYFANGYYGIEAACHGYFNCELKDLDISQVAFLCAIPNRPSYYDPLTNMENTLDRRDLILQNMYEDGKLSQEDYYAALKEEIVLNRPQDSSDGQFNNYVDTYVYDCATRALMSQEGFTFQYYFDSEEEEETYDETYEELYSACQKKLYSGGYKIYTSIDMTLQEQLQTSVDDALSEFTETDDEGIYKMQASAVTIDNDNGYVVAIVGGRDQNFTTYTLNRAYQSHRQPGSSIKPLLVYTPQLERGYDPDTLVDDHEIEDGPENASGTYAGEVTLRYAVAHSLNTIAWQLYDELTPEVGLQYLKNMNFSAIDENDYVLATALGGFTNGVSAVEMASGYATLANDGLYREPTCIKTIVDSDENIVYASEQTERAVYEQEAARMMTDMLTTVMESGTGKKAKLSDMPCAGKTGTTNDHKDGWFCGYTRYYTTAVWVGCDYPEKIQDLSGSTYPATIWKTYMEAIHEGLVSMDFLPYAKLSDEFLEQQQSEQEEQEKRREENRTNESDNTDNGDAGENGDDANTDDNGNTGENGDDANTGDNGDAGENGSNENTGNTDANDNGGDANDNGNADSDDDTDDNADNDGNTDAGDADGGAEEEGNVQ